jgi:hypothetical protein
MLHLEHDSSRPCPNLPSGQSLGGDTEVQGYQKYLNACWTIRRKPPQEYAGTYMCVALEMPS